MPVCAYAEKGPILSAYSAVGLKMGGDEQA